MAYFRCGGGGMPAGLQSGMDAVLNKKFGTSTTYPPADWPDTVNLMGPLPERTASGSIAHIEDGASEVPLKNWLVTLPASLSGYSSIVGTKSGKNLLQNLKYQASANRVNIGQSDDGFSISLRAGTYTLSVTSNTEVRAYYRGELDGSNTLIWSAYSTSGNGTFTLSEDKDVRIWVTGQTSITASDVLTMQLEVGSSASAYTAYEAPTQYTASLGRTIYGGTADIVNGTGHSTRIKKTVRWGDLGNVTQLADVTRKEIVLSASEEPKYTMSSASTDLLNDKNLPYDMTYSGNFEHIYIANSARIWVYLPNGTDANTEISVTYTLADALQTDFTFTGQEVPTRLGYNAFWSDEGDTEVTYRQDIDLALGGN